MPSRFGGFPGTARQGRCVFSPCGWPLPENAIIPRVTVHAQTTPDIEITPDQQTELEPLYRVLIHNDDVTPMDFVTHILVTIFFLAYPDAVEIMLTAHRTGLAVVQILPKTEAEKRINKAHFAAGLEGYPLHFSMEPE